MVQTLKAQTIDLRYLIENFGLERIRDDQFFWEWQAELPELTDIDCSYTVMAYGIQGLYNLN